MPDSPEPLSQQSVAVWGGTFDPVHLGHIDLAKHLRDEFQFDGLSLMPACIPPHKALPGVESGDRAAMVELAITGTGLTIDRRELNRGRPNYTVDSLAEIRQELGAEVKLSFCMGMDSLVNLHSWHRWLDLFQYAHIVVVARPQWQLQQIAQSQLKQELERRLCSPIEFSRTEQTAGNIVVCNSPLLDISSTEIRRRLKSGESACNIESLAPEVAEYIQHRGLYR